MMWVWGKALSAHVTAEHTRQLRRDYFRRRDARPNQRRHTGGNLQHFQPAAAQPRGQARIPGLTFLMAARAAKSARRILTIDCGADGSVAATIHMKSFLSSRSRSLVPQPVPRKFASSWRRLIDRDAMKDAISYIRVSSDEQADSGLGLEAQRQRIAAYCALKGLHLAEAFEDPGVSGGKPLASRPAGSQLLAAAKKTQAVVVVAKLDRLFRSVADATIVIAEFDKKGIELVAIAEGFGTTNPYGRAMAQMATVFAELERAMIRERTRNAMSVKRARGPPAGAKG
jgi:hypothetical protein